MSFLIQKHFIVFELHTICINRLLYSKLHWHKKNFDNDGQQKSEPKAAKHSLSTRPSSFPNVFQWAAEEIVLYLKTHRIVSCES